MCPGEERLFCSLVHFGSQHRLCSLLFALVHSCSLLFTGLWVLEAFFWYRSPCNIASKSVPERSVHLEEPAQQKEQPLQMLG